MKNKTLTKTNATSTHTPGPWMAWPCCDEDDYTPRYAEVLKDPRPAGGIFDDTQPLICRAFYGKTDDERLANARLIAAAPELLEALDVIAKFSEGLSNSRCFRSDCTEEQFRYIAEWRNTIEDARNAIAKATGQD